MAKKKRAGSRAISDDTVCEKTGKSWNQWFSILDKFDVETNGHTAAAKHLRDKFKTHPWWAQIVTIRYEWERGLRKESD